MADIKLNHFYKVYYRGHSYLAFVYRSSYLAYEAYFLTSNANSPYSFFSAAVARPVLNFNSVEVSYYNGMKILDDYYSEISKSFPKKCGTCKQYINDIQKRYYNMKYGY